MTKEQFLKKYFSNTALISPDLNAVIAHEIEQAKAQPEKTNKIVITPHTLVEINRAFRVLKEDKSSYIHNVFSDDGVFDAMNEIQQVYKSYFGGEERQIQPTEKPAPATDQVTDQDAPKFDQDRFEAMFRAVVATGEYSTNDCIIVAEEILKQLDAYYATKKGGSNE